MIIYGEYIPVTLNSDTISEYDLRLGEPHYDPDLQPQALNEFATAAFRYGHSEVTYIILEADYSPYSLIKLRLVLYSFYEGVWLKYIILLTVHFIC